MADKLKSSNKNRRLITWLVIIAFFGIVAANLVVWKNYFAEKSEIDVLKTEVLMVNQQIAQSPEPSPDLESELQQAEDDLAVALEVFPQNVDRNDVVDFILDTAEICDVQIIPLVSDGWETKHVGQSYTILKYRGTVIGKISDATNFITMLRSGDYPTLVITECVVDRTTGLEIDVADSEIEVTIEISIELYTASVLASKDTGL